MATKKKASNAKKKTNKSVSNGAKSKSKIDENKKRINDEIVAIVMLVVGIFLAIAMHTDLAGIVGERISDFLKGIFGLGGVILPYFLILFAVMLFIKMSKPFTAKTVILVSVIFVMIDILNAGRFLNGFDLSTTHITEVYERGVLLRNGGVAGMYLGALIKKVVGMSGLYLFSIAAIIICLLLTINTPISRAYENARAKREERKENKRLASEEKKQNTKNKNEAQDLKADAISKISEEQTDFLSLLNKYGDDKDTSKEHIIELWANDERYGAKKEKDDLPNATDSENVDSEKTTEELTKALDSTNSEDYTLPPLSLLKINKKKAITKKEGETLAENAQLLEETLKSFNVEAKVINVTRGSSVTRYEIQPAIGVKVASIVRLADDIALNLRARSIRIEAPIPGKAAVGIEVENEVRQTVTIGDIISSAEFKKNTSKLAFAVGKDIAGNSVVADLAKMPHMLIAGATGSGKSVCINTIITSILYRAKPDEVKLLLIDPKMVELGNYNGIPHLLIPVVTDSTKAAAALNWAVSEMTSRYKRFAENKVKDIKAFNAFMKREGRTDEIMSQIVIIIDELADLMMVASSQVEEAICRLAQLARAAGMHLIVATQRPSVDVVTGLIKANIPSRIAFMVSSQIDSRTIIDMPGAEKLVGNGDMLYKPQDLDKPMRIQGPFISDEELKNIIKFVKAQNEEVSYDQEISDSIEKGDVTKVNSQEDELMDEAIQTVINAGQASVSMLQRRFRIGYNRAARIIEDMQDAGVVGPPDGSRPRSVLWSQEDLEAKKEGKKDE